MTLAQRRRALLERHGVYVSSDSPFQARLRLGQSLWREAHGLAPGPHRGGLLGSRLTPEDAAAGANFVDPETARAMLDRVQTDALIDRGRLEGNLLGSQTLAVNLFAPMAADLDLATRVFRHLVPGRVTKVRDIRLEWSPGRGNPRYLGNRSAFDVLVEYSSMGGESASFGIEVKLHEDLHDPVPTKDPAGYDEVAAASGAFVPGADLYRPPTWQLWLDHLLALSLLQAGDYEAGHFVLLAPSGNPAVRHAADLYRRALGDPSTFFVLTLEDVLAALLLHGSGPWVSALWDRYGEQTRLLQVDWPQA